MKRLYLLRHAKSSWDNASLSDFDRPLNERGRQAAPFMGGLMAERRIRPDLIVSSPAKRAAETAELVRAACDPAIPIRHDERIYEASTQTLLYIISEIADAADSAMLVGHNPGMAGMIYLLTGAEEPMPTAALASIRLEIDRWSQTRPRSGQLEFVIRPKEVMKKAPDATARSEN